MATTKNNYPNLTKALSRLGSVAIFGLVVIVFATCGMTTTIKSGETGVKFDTFSGTNLAESYGEGLHVHWPWQRIIAYNVRAQEQLEEITALSNNGLSIDMEVSIRWRPKSDQLAQLHVSLGPDYYRIVVQPELRSAAREVVGQYTPEELYSTQRSVLQQGIFDRVRTAADARYVEIDAVLIRDVELPEQIRAAIENKLQEEQEAERYQFTIEKERLEAQRKEIEAQGEATYQRIITASLSAQFLRFKGIEATRELANSPNSKTVVIGSGGDGLPLILGNQ